MYLGIGKPDNAIATWQKLQSVAPDDHDLALNLGELYMTRKRYAEAASLYESATKANPSDAFAQLRLGMARLRNHNLDLGIDALRKAAEIDSGGEMLNDVAYEMVEAGTSLPDALAYSQRAVSDAEERSQKMNVDKLQKADLQITLAISAYWDTLWWIYFKMGDLANAESYLNSAWQLGQNGVTGDHLAQVYEKEQKLPAALHMYSLALEANPHLEETRSRIKQLAQVSLPKSTISAQEELSRMRTLTMPTITAETASADFDIVLVANGKPEQAIFFRGSELLRKAGESLEKLQFDEPLPPKSGARLLRRGNLSCAANSCSLTLYPPEVAVAQN
jgi:tetratricopeptide (TPR) repeat protein